MFKKNICANNRYRAFYSTSWLITRQTLSLQTGLVWWVPATSQGISSFPVVLPQAPRMFNHYFPIQNLPLYCFRYFSWVSQSFSSCFLAKSPFLSLQELLDPGLPCCSELLGCPDNHFSRAVKVLFLPLLPTNPPHSTVGGPGPP